MERAEIIIVRNEARPAGVQRMVVPEPQQASLRPRDDRHSLRGQSPRVRAKNRVPVTDRLVHADPEGAAQESQPAGGVQHARPPWPIGSA